MDTKQDNTIPPNNKRNNQENKHAKQALQRRLQEVQAILKTLKAQKEPIQTTYFELMALYQEEIKKATRDYDDELHRHEASVNHSTALLDEWNQHERSMALMELEKRKTWWYRFLILLAALMSANSFLTHERRVQEKWQRHMRQPIYGEEQREWQRLAIDAQRHIQRSHPQPTPGMRRIEQQVAQARQRFYAITNHIQVEESRIEVLQNQIAAL